MFEKNRWQNVADAIFIMGIRPQHHHPVVSGGNCHHLPDTAQFAARTITYFYQAINTRPLCGEEITTEGRHTLYLTEV